MELKNFVAATLNEIQEGVQLAIERSKSRGTSGAINPSFGIAPADLKESVQEIQFDIAVTVSDKISDKVEGGIKVIALNFGGGVSDTTESSKVSRIQFSIPIIPPTTLLEEIRKP